MTEGETRGSRPRARWPARPARPKPCRRRDFQRRRVFLTTAASVSARIRTSNGAAAELACSNTRSACAGIRAMCSRKRASRRYADLLEACKGGAQALGARHRRDRGRQARRHRGVRSRHARCDGRRERARRVCVCRRRGAGEKRDGRRRNCRRGWTARHRDAITRGIGRRWQKLVSVARTVPRIMSAAFSAIMIDRRVDVAADQIGKHRRVDHAQAFRAVHAQLAVDHRASRPRPCGSFRPGDAP